MANSERVEQRAAYIGISTTFLALFTLFSALIKNRRAVPEVRPFDFLLLVLATLRLGRMVAYDKVMDTYRLPFTKTVEDVTGAGKTVVPKGEGLQKALGELISCPICSGTWIAAALVYAFHLLPVPARLFITIFASIGGAEVLNGLTEAMLWTGEAERKEVGEE